MGRKKLHKNSFNLTPKTYPKLLLDAILNQKSYISNIKEITNPGQIILFFITNAILISLIRFIVKISIDKNYSLIFQSISQSIFFLPFAFLWLALACIFLYLISLFLRGSLNFLDTIRAVVFATPALIFLSIPLVGPIFLVLFVYLLVLTFKNFHNYGFDKAVINVVFPALLILLILITTGIIEPLLQGIDIYRYIK